MLPHVQPVKQQFLRYELVEQQFKVLCPMKTLHVTLLQSDNFMPFIYCSGLHGISRL